MRATPLRRPSAVSQSVRLGYVGRSGCHRHLRPYLHENTASRPISKVKHGRDSLVLSWETRWESGLLQFSLLFFFTFLHLLCVSTVAGGGVGGLPACTPQERPSALRSRRRRRKFFWLRPGTRTIPNATASGEGDPLAHGGRTRQQGEATEPGSSRPVSSAQRAGRR